MTWLLRPPLRFLACGFGFLVLMSGCALLLLGSQQTASAAPLCSVEFSLPSGSTAQLLPGESATFSYSAVITAAEVHQIGLQITGGSASGLAVSIQPQSTSFDVGLSRAPQSYPVSGSITVTVPDAAAPGIYTVGGLGAVSTCVTRTGAGPQTSMGRDFAGEITITVVMPVAPSPTPTPTATPQPASTPTPEPTSTPIPPPVLCEPALTLTGDSNLEVAPGSQVSVPFEASVVVRRVSQATLMVSSRYHGPLDVAIDPSQSEFSFDPLSSTTALRTFSGAVSISVPAGQPPGSYTIDGFVASAACQGVDQAGSPASFSARSTAANITLRLAAPAATPTSAATYTAIPSATPTVWPSATPSGTLTVAPTATQTASDSPTSTRTRTATPTRSPAPGTSTALPTSSATPTATQRGIVRSPSAAAGETTGIVSTAAPTASVSPAATPQAVVAGVSSGSTVLDWTEDREVVASQDEDESYVELIVGAGAVLLIAGGSYGAWRARGGLTGGG